MSTILIRKSEDKDIEAVFALIQELAAFVNDPKGVVTTVNQMRAERNNYEFFVAEDVESNTIVGYVLYFFGYFTWNGKVLYLVDLYVQERFRGRKTGSRLLKAVFDEAKAHDCHMVRWQVRRWNQQATDFYRSLGTEIDDSMHNCYLSIKNAEAALIDLDTLD